MHKTGPVVLDCIQPLSGGDSVKQHHRRDADIDDDENENVAKENLSDNLIAKPAGLSGSSDKSPVLVPTLTTPIQNTSSIKTELDKCSDDASRTRTEATSPMNKSHKTGAIESRTKHLDASNVLTEKYDGVKVSTPQHIVKWMQSNSLILVKVYVTNVKEYTCSIEDNGNKLDFSAYSQVEQKDKLQQFRFSLTLYSTVDKCHCCKLSRYLSIELKKTSPSDNHWPRLTRTPDRIDWIRECFYSSGTADDCSSDVMHGDEDADGLDFQDKLEAFEEIERQIIEAQKNYNNCKADDQQTKISNESDDQTKQKERYTKSGKANKKLIKIDCQSKKIPNKDIFNPFKKNLNRFKGQRRSLFESKKCMIGDRIDSMKYDYRREYSNTMDVSKNTAKHALNCKKTYLFLYNLLMFIMFLMVHMILTIKGLTGSMDDDSVQGAAFIIKLLTYTQLLESIHPMLGLVPGGPFMPFLQVIGRLLVNHFLTNPDIRLNSAPYAHYLFIVWSSIEIFRYSFYALRVFNVEIYPITWCRYTLFMPLYPMGGFCESQIVLATVRHYETSGDYSISLPNAANFSFNLPSFLKFYTYALLGPSIFYLMKYMWSQRCKQLKEKIA